MLTRFGFIVDPTIDGVPRRIDPVIDRANRAADAFRNMFAGLAALSALNSLAKTADEMQSLEARMGQMEQTVGNVGETFEAVSKHATDARQKISAYATLYIRIGNASQDLIKDQTELLGIIDTVAQALVVGGVASSEQASAMLQLSQAFNKGKLDGDEFKSVMEAMPTTFTRSLAAAMGYANGLGDFYKASEEGKLTIEELIKALKTIGPETARQFVAMPLTISQSFTIIGNRFQTFIARLNRESGAVTNIANFFIGAFNAIEDGLDGLVKFFGGATPTLKFFGIALAAALAPLVFKVAAGALLFLISPLGLLIAGLMLLGLAIEDVYQWVTGGKSIIGGWLGDFEKAKASFLHTWGKVWIGIKAVLLVIGAAMVAATVMWIGAIAQFVIGALVWVGVLAATWIASFVSMAIAVVSATLPIVLLAAALASVLTALYILWDNWKLIMGMIYDLATGNWKGVADGFMKMVDKIKGYWSSFKSFFGMGVSTTIDATTAAGAASSASGVPTRGAGGTTNVTVNQTLPPGTSAEVAQSAKAMTERAGEASFDKFSRQAAQAS